MKCSFSRGLLPVMGALAAILSAAPAHAANVFGFNNIFPNGGNANGDAFVNQLSFDVTDASPGKVQFKFNFNATGGAPANSFVRQIFFADNNGTNKSTSTVKANAFFSGVTFNGVSSSLGNNYTISTPGGNLPQGNNVLFNNGNTFRQGTTDFEAVRVSGQGNGQGNSGALNPGEMAAFLLTLQQGKTLNDVVSALNSRSLLVGLHLQGLASGGSDSFVSGTSIVTPPTPVPTPAAVLPALFGMGVAAIRKRKSAPEEVA